MVTFSLLVAATPSGGSQAWGWTQPALVNVPQGHREQKQKPPRAPQAVMHSPRQQMCETAGEGYSEGVWYAGCEWYNACAERGSV